MRLDEVDLLDFDRFQRGEHHDMFTVLRRSGNGIHFIDEPDGPGFWAITRIDHLREVNRESATAFLVVTHDQGIADRCDRIVHMIDGLVDSDVVTESGKTTGGGPG